MFDCKRGRLLSSNYSEYSLETSPGELKSLAEFRNSCRSNFPVPLGSQLATVFHISKSKTVSCWWRSTCTFEPHPYAPSRICLSRRLLR